MPFDAMSKGAPWNYPIEHLAGREHGALQKRLHHLGWETATFTFFEGQKTGRFQPEQPFAAENLNDPGGFGVLMRHMPITMRQITNGVKSPGAG